MSVAASRSGAGWQRGEVLERGESSGGTEEKAGRAGMAAGGASWGKRAFGRSGAGAAMKRARATGRGAGGDVVLGGPRGGRCEVGSARGAALCG